MRVRDIKNLPLFLEPAAQIVGRVERAVIGDNLRLAYVIVETEERGTGMVNAQDLVITPESVIIQDLNSIKSYQHGEELSIYQKKLGDRIYDEEGKEVGTVSDFFLSNDKRVREIEVSSGVLSDILQGRAQIPIEQVHWRSINSGLIEKQGSD
jgi:uncharacterized protein YrrD